MVHDRIKPGSGKNGLHVVPGEWNYVSPPIELLRGFQASLGHGDTCQRVRTQAFHYDVSIMGARRAAEGEEEPPLPRPAGPLKPIPPETCRWGPVRIHRD